MAFIKLFPAKNGKWLATDDIIDRLKTEFRIVDADVDAGRDHVGDMIVATLKFSDKLPFKAQQLRALQAGQEFAVSINFGDDLAVCASCCLMPQHELFFGSPDEVDGPARALVDRCAQALNYELHEG